jgi:DNA polymerase I-like protein with 3'-5' exonuclease and polymerase domains
MVSQYVRKLQLLVDDSRSRLEKAGFVRADGSRDTKRVREHMLAACLASGLEPKLTATKQVSLDAEACRAIPSDELLAAYSLYSTADKVLTRAEELLEGSRGLPLQTQFVSLLENGRTSSRNPKPPLIGCQVQNLPREGDLRKCFIPRPGYVFCSIDFSADEIACFAQAELNLTGQSLLAEALREGLDVHCLLAADLLGEPYAKVYANRKHGMYKHVRQLAKIGNFGLLGGMGAQSLMRNANSKARKPEDRITLQQAFALRESWYRRWQTKPYFAAVNGALGRDPYDNVCTIRQFGSGRIRGAMSYTEACNTLFSGLAGDSNKDVLWACVSGAMTARPGEHLYDTHVVNFLHDELFFELPENRATECATALCDLMLNVKRKWLPLVPSGAEPAIMKRWYKDAEPVWSPDGSHLLCWEPAIAA